MIAVPYSLEPGFVQLEKLMIAFDFKAFILFFGSGNH